MKNTKSSGRRYSQEFKQQAVELLLAGNLSMNQVAQELGVTLDSIRAWKAKYLGGAGSVQRDGRTVSATELEKELRALRQENEHLRRQREILKKALGILSDGPQPSGMPYSNP
jgi:transposase